MEAENWHEKTRRFTHSILFIVAPKRLNLRGQMSTKNPKILTVAAALAALPNIPAATSSLAEAKGSEALSTDPSKPNDRSGQPNAFANVGSDVLGFIVTNTPDGLVLAQHFSHSSHASHASHYSSSV
jgi:hypothetical protein